MFFIVRYRVRTQTLDGTLLSFARLHSAEKYTPGYDFLVPTANTNEAP